jgi:tRNA guanosine-2'-O-methyltransferase
VPVHDRVANLLSVSAALVTAAWEALMGHKGVKRLAALAAMMSTLLHPALFSQPELHGARSPPGGPPLDDGATVEVEAAPIKWLVHRLLTAGDKSARLMRVLALQLCGVFVTCPDVAGGYYLPVMLRLCLHGQAVGIGVDRDLQEELSVSTVTREHYARLPPPPDASLARMFENSVRQRVVLLIASHQ